MPDLGRCCAVLEPYGVSVVGGRGVGFAGSILGGGMFESFVDTLTISTVPLDKSLGMHALRF